MGLAQSADKQALKMVLKNPKTYFFKEFHSGGKIFALICDNDKIVIAKSQQQRIVDWYHD